MNASARIEALPQATIVLIAGSLLNPAGRIYIPTSGAATGLGAMVGLMLVPKLLARGTTGLAAGPAPQPLHIGRGWMAAAIVLGPVFILVFGPGIPL